MGPALNDDSRLRTESVDEVDEEDDQLAFLFLLSHNGVPSTPEGGAHSQRGRVGDMGEANGGTYGHVARQADRQRARHDLRREEVMDDYCLS